MIFFHTGTGKTKTLVAAIEQILRKTNKYVLVCAMTNAAADEIAERLLDIFPSNRSSTGIHRLYSVSYNLDKISKIIQPACNISKEKDVEDKLAIPPIGMLYQYRVVICTLSASSCLSQKGIQLNKQDPSLFKPNHFQYVFIDECASSHEPMTLIPICGKY